MTKRVRLARPPVDSLPDVAWARIERGVWSRLDGHEPVPVSAPRRGRRAWLWLSVPALAAALALILVLGTRGDAPAPADGEPARFVSGAAPSSLTFGDAYVTLDAHSAIVMTRATIPTAVIERGGAWFAVARRDAGAPFVVVAGDAVVRVLGTRFHATRDGEHAAVEVERGLVEIQFRGASVRASAGHRWTSAQPGAVSAGEPASVEAASAATPPTPEPPEQPPPPPPRPEPVPSPSSDAQRMRFEQLAALEARDPAASLTGYLELSRGTGRWAEIALFAAARLAADRGDPRAVALLDRYLRRFPRGANVDDARELRARLKGNNR